MTTVIQQSWLYGSMPSVPTKGEGKINRITERRDCGCSVQHVTYLLFPRLWRWRPVYHGTRLTICPQMPGLVPGL